MIATTRIEACRSCEARGLVPVLSLGPLPIADRLLTEDALSHEEPRVPLDVVRCTDCGLVQITETVPPELIFDGDYPYFSSVSSTLLEHSRLHVEELITAHGLGPGSLVLEIASNDGYLLRHFVARGIPVLGVDPASGQARAARAAGVPTLCEFFDERLAARLVAEGRRADVLIANNVLAHVPRPNEFVRGIEAVLAPGGIAVFEFPYLSDLLAHCEFDTMYHQHVCYFSLGAVSRLLERNGLHVADVRRLSIHGGSLRVTATRETRGSAARDELLAQEAETGLHEEPAYLAFREAVDRVRRELVDLVDGLRAEGCRLAAYGAAAKGTTLLACCGIGAERIEYVVDLSPSKHGRWMPGSRIPIRPVSALTEDPPDVLLLLPWNFADEILAQQAPFRAAGGRFLVPIPRPRIV